MGYELKKAQNSSVFQDFKCKTTLRISDWNGTRTHNYLILKQTLTHLAKETRMWHTSL